jgi:hypothetical protein
MDETTAAGAPRSRRLIWTAVTVALLAGLGALGLSLYNTARLDDRVHDYVVAHRAALAGVPGPQGARGATGPVGPAGPIGLPSKPVDLSSYSSCLEFELEQWLDRSRVDISTLGVLPSGTVRAGQLYLSCT